MSILGEIVDSNGYPIKMGDILIGRGAYNDVEGVVVEIADGGVMLRLSTGNLLYACAEYDQATLKMTMKKLALERRDQVAE